MLRFCRHLRILLFFLVLARSDELSQLFGKVFHSKASTAVCFFHALYAFKILISYMFRNLLLRFHSQRISSTTYKLIYIHQVQTQNSKIWGSKQPSFDIDYFCLIVQTICMPNIPIMPL